MYRNCLTFILNGEITSVQNIRGDMTLLEWLRHRRRLTGSKEGCGEGDCGACTVVVAKIGLHGKLQSRPVNACILFMGMIEGCSIHTVESLVGPEGQLHPCQQTLVDNNGSQCGFCTPGFVMSLFTAWRNGDGLEANQIDYTLAGNLCRCTGYLPIVNAGLALTQLSVPSWETDRRLKEVAALKSIKHNQSVKISDGDKSFSAPIDENEFAELVKKDTEATIVSGATDVGLWVTKQHRHLKNMIWTGRVKEFDEIKQLDNEVIIRPAVSHQKVLQALSNRWPAMGELLRRFGSVQVRGTGTLCGNVANASPIGDMPPLLIALGAIVELRYGSSTRTVPIEKYFLKYGQQDRKKGEFISAIIIPVKETTGLRCYKLSKRFDQDISAVMMAANVVSNKGVITQARLAFGGMAETPMQAVATEKMLIGQALELNSFVTAAAYINKDFNPLTDMRGSAEYRLQAARNLVLKYGHELTNSTEINLAGQGSLKLMENISW